MTITEGPCTNTSDKSSGTVKVFAYRVKQDPILYLGPDVECSPGETYLEPAKIPLAFQKDFEPYINELGYLSGHVLTMSESALILITIPGVSFVEVEGMQLIVTSEEEIRELLENALN
jgi:hypothetical protein